MSKFKSDTPRYTAKMLRQHLTASATNLFTKFGRTASKGSKGGGKGHKGEKEGKSTVAPCKPGVICFEYREQGSCSNTDCKGIHEGRTGKCCSNASYLEYGKCSDAASCLDVHVWDSTKWGDRNEAVSKLNNRMHKAAALAGPLAMMYETNVAQGVEWTPPSSEEESEPECEPIQFDDVRHKESTCHCAIG